MTRNRLLSLPSGILVLAGLWLVASPWLVAAVPTPDVVVWNCVITGILIALIAGSELWGAARSPALGALSGLLGVWGAASPFVLGYSSDRPWTWSSVITGVVVFGLALTDATTREGARREAEIGARAHGPWVGGRYRPAERRVADGEFRGVGPKGWRRPDDDIRMEVCTRMADHPALDASEIDVIVSNGEVRLVGIVPSRGARRLAEDIADSVSGVRDVANELRPRRADDDIRRVA